MCYPQPGPRCHKHALITLNNAHSRMSKAQEEDEANPTPATRQRLAEARENLAYRQREYDTTNEGLVELAYAYRNETDSGAKDRYRRRLTLAKNRREKQDAWAQEYNAQKRQKERGASKKLRDIEKSIKNVDKEYSTPLFEPDMDKRKHVHEMTAETPQRPAETPQRPVETVEESVAHPAPAETVQTPAEPVETVETPEKQAVKPEKRNTQDSEEETMRKGEVITVSSFDFASPRAQGRKRSLSARSSHVNADDRSETAAPVPVSLSYASPDSAEEKLESQGGYHYTPSLHSAYGDTPVETRVVLLPRGRKAWEITQEDGSRTRLMMPSSSNPETRKRYYARFGFEETMETVPGRVAYSPHLNEYVVKAA